MSFYIGDTKIIGVYVGSTEIKSSYVGDIKVYGEDEPIVNYLKFTAKANNSTIGLGTISTGQTMEYTTDGTNWLSMTTATTIQLSSGDSAYIRGMLTSSNSLNNYTKFTMSGDIKASGNINYLWNYSNPDAPLIPYCGERLFSGCTALSDITELELPSTTLAENCYQNLFRGCKSLTDVSGLVLPAMTLANSCYSSMFAFSSIVTPPSLPATTLATSCYENMFGGCSSLLSAPELSATELTDSCYRAMFRYCSGLTTVQTILPATTTKNRCYSYMFADCNSLTTAPELPAETLYNEAYQYMFSGCSKLSEIKCLATNISAPRCTQNWVIGVAPTGTFTKNPNMTSWTTGNNGIPTNWTVQDAT